jgi:cobalt/nickel transport system permease protein
MHMADALLSPAVGVTMLAVSGGTIALCSAKLRRELDDRKVPLMGVLGAFLFAAQMINFSIPGTGSSGHLGGGLLLAILLGPSAAFLTIASVLVVQALFFADGGLLALGCNIFNMGFFPAFIVFPFLYKKLIGSDPGRSRVAAVTILCAVVGLQLGSFSVVLETVCSGISSLPFTSFMMLMQPIHLAIGIVEGMVTAAVVSFVRQARPELVDTATVAGADRKRGLRGLAVIMASALCIAGVLSWYASKDPDGLEWSVARVTGKTELKAPEHPMHQALAALQKKSAWFPDYSLPKAAESAAMPAPVSSTGRSTVNVGTSLAGIVGTLLTLLLALLAGFLLKRRSNHVA